MTVIVILDNGKVITYDGGGETSVGPDGRPYPDRDELDSLPKLNDGEKYYEVESSWENAKQEKEALDYAYKHVWQLPYNRLGPNSNTYAHALLNISHLKVKPYNLEVQTVIPPGIVVPGGTVITSVPEGAVGWNGPGYGGADSVPGNPQPKQPLKP